MAHTTIEQAEICVRRYLDDIWSQADMAAADELLTPDFVFSLTFNTTNGRDEFKALLKTESCSI